MLSEAFPWLWIQEVETFGFCNPWQFIYISIFCDDWTNDLLNNFLLKHDKGIILTFSYGTILLLQINF